MKSSSVILVLVGMISTLSSIDGAKKIDVQAEINKMTSKFDQLEKPSPAMVNSVMEQIKESCRTNRTIDEENLATNMSKCMEGLFNQTALGNELQEAIPKGNLDNVFRNICLKWPKVKVCMKPALDIIDECWENGTLVNSGLDTMVDFFCGKDNDGAYIALFFAEGGLSCLEAHGDKVRDCVNLQNTDEHQEDLCRSVEQVYHCLTPLRKCDDVTPHNLVTSMMQQVGRVMHCPQVMEQYQGNSVGGAAGRQRIAILESLFILAVSLTFRRWW